MVRINSNLVVSLPFCFHSSVTGNLQCPAIATDLVRNILILAVFAESKEKIIERVSEQEASSASLK